MRPHNRSFAVDSIKNLGQYYDVFKEVNEEWPEAKRYKIVAIFSYGANEEDDRDKFSVEDYERAINEFVGSALGHKSESAFKGLLDDNLIASHQREYDKLKELKKGLLQQMFV